MEIVGASVLSFAIAAGFTTLELITGHYPRTCFLISGSYPPAGLCGDLWPDRGGRRPVAPLPQRPFDGVDRLLCLRLSGLRKDTGAKILTNGTGEAGAALTDVVRVRVYVPDIADLEAVVGVVARRLGPARAANTTVCAPLAVPEAKVEIEVTAVRDGAGGDAGTLAAPAG